MKLALTFAALAVAQVLSSPVGGKQTKTIDFDKFVPRYPTVTPWDSEKKWPDVLLKRLMKMGPQESVRHPGYKKGTDDFRAVCGTPETSRIVGGEEATPHSYPWMAALFVDDKWFCGGTLISDEWVLTAAHCAQDASTMDVMLGAHNVREAQEEGRIQLTTRDFFTHPDWSSFNLHNDLALVHLPEKVNFTSQIKPICLPAHSEAGTDWAHEAAWASGWGKPEDSATSISPVLRHVDTETITNLACALQFPTVINKNILCISGKNGKSTCNGDSGGPLHLESGGVYKQVGITSFGSSLGCELGFHAAFTRTASYLEWIETESNVVIDP